MLSKNRSLLGPGATREILPQVVESTVSQLAAALITVPVVALADVLPAPHQYKGVPAASAPADGINIVMPNPITEPDINGINLFNSVFAFLIIKISLKILLMLKPYPNKLGGAMTFLQHFIIEASLCYSLI